MFQLYAGESVRLLNRLLDFVAVSGGGGASRVLALSIFSYSSEILEKRLQAATRGGLEIVPPFFLRNEREFRREPSAPWCQLPACFRRSLSASENRKDCGHL